MKNISNYLAPIIALIALLAIWEIFVYSSNIPIYILPAPTDIFLSLHSNLNDLLGSALITLRITIYAFVIAFFVSLFLAIVFSLSNILESSLYPITVIFQVTPVVAIAPLILIWVGLDNAELAILILSVILVIINFTSKRRIILYTILSILTLGLHVFLYFWTIEAFPKANMGIGWYITGIGVIILIVAPFLEKSGAKSSETID